MIQSRDRSIQIWDGARAFFSSAIQPLSDTFAMLLLIHCYDPNVTQKTIMGSVAGIGLLSGAPLLRCLRHSQRSPSHLLSKILLLSSACMFLVPWFHNVWIYMTLVAVGVMLPIAAMPLLTEIYAQFKKEQRGQRFMTSMLAMNAGVITMAALGRWLFELRSDGFWLFHLFGASLFVSAMCCLKMPTEYFKRDFQRFGQLISTLKEDGLFSYMCLAWFILGAGNLWLYPYRTNYLVEAGLGPELSPSEAVTLVVIIPELLRFVTAPIYARLFDQMNFIVLRMIINAFFAIYALIFFSSSSYHGVLLGSIFLGLAHGGGSFAWNLWVTKIAPAEKAATYMIIHSTLTGVRRFLCPMMGLWALNVWGGTYCSYVSASLMLVSTLMLVPILSMGSRFKH
jgi:predicted MFS family arabinose efflux permease